MRKYRLVAKKGEGTFSEVRGTWEPTFGPSPTEHLCRRTRAGAGAAGATTLGGSRFGCTGINHPVVAHCRPPTTATPAACKRPCHPPKTAEGLATLGGDGLDAAARGPLTGSNWPTPDVGRRCAM